MSAMTHTALSGTPQGHATGTHPSPRSATIGDAGVPSYNPFPAIREMRCEKIAESRRQRRQLGMSTPGGAGATASASAAACVADQQQCSGSAMMTSRTLVAWRATGQKIRLKHEPLVEGVPGAVQPASTPKPLPGEVRAREAAAAAERRRMLERRGDANSERPFVAGAMERRAGAASGDLATALAAVQVRLNEDWGTPITAEDPQTGAVTRHTVTTAVCSSSPAGLLQIAFFLPLVDRKEACRQYCNVLAQTEPTLCGFRKMAQMWGLERQDDNEDCWLFFVLAPSAMKLRSTDAYYSLHPRTCGSLFSMSAAGVQVLESIAGAVGTAASKRAQVERTGREKIKPIDGEPKKNEVDISVLEVALDTYQPG